jgi:hypothetical protein
MLGCEGDPTSPADEPAATGSLTGTVTTTVLNIPVVGARVCVEISGGNTLCGTTDAAGLYSITSIPDGSHNVHFTAAGYDSSTTLYYFSDGAAKSYDYHITGNCIISGTVLVDSTNLPIYPFAKVETYYQDRLLAFDFSDAAGAFTVDRLPPFRFKLKTVNIGYYPDSTTVTASPTPSTVDFRVRVNPCPACS